MLLPSLLAAEMAVAAAQGISLGVSSATGNPGSSVLLNLSIAPTGNTLPSAFAWTLNYSLADVSAVTVTPGPVAALAGKSISCSQAIGSLRCLLWGLNSIPIQAGIVAHIGITLSALTTSSTTAITLSNVLAVDSSAVPLPAMWSGASVFIQQGAGLNGFWCSPLSLAPPAVSTCTVTLLPAAPVTGATISIASSSPSLQVPPAIAIPPGAASASFTATPGAVSASTLATLTASYLGFAETFTLSVNPPVVPSGGLQFVPVTPCRVADTRAGQGTTGAFGPPSMSASSVRDFPIPSGACRIPASAMAYSLNVTAVPSGPLGFLTVYPSGQPGPGVSTLNSSSGAIAANAAIVTGGSNGAISVYVTDKTDVILDINGYFALPPATGGLAFFPATPCRVVDTRPGQGIGGVFGPPQLLSGTTRDFPISSSSCGIPAAAKAYSLNVTVVPSAGLSFLSAWPSGLNRPFVSTLNPANAPIAANAAVVPAGANGAVSIFVTDTTDLIIDINGYFADPAFVSPAGLTGLLFFPATPCRVADTRPGQGFSGLFGPPRLPGGPTGRVFPIPSSPCGITTGAQAYVLNLTVVPPAPLSFLTAWPTGQPTPLVSTLNSPDGSVAANLAIVPAGTAGAITLLSPEPTDAIIDVTGFFARP